MEWAALCLEQGLLVGIPTETVYGLAGNAYNMAAVLSIFAAKRRPYNDPLIVHTDRLERVLTFAREMPPAAHALAAAFWPGPLTLLSFALMVMGHSMAPEFLENEIILIEPEGLAKEGSYVLALHNEAWTFRQLLRTEAGWALHALNPAFADEPVADLSCVRGVIVQKALPGRRRASKYYV